VKLSKMPAVNCSTYSSICRTSTPLNTIELGSKINFPTSGAMLLIFIIDFLLVLIIIIGWCELGSLSRNNYLQVKEKRDFPWFWTRKVKFYEHLIIWSRNWKVISHRNKLQTN
jgi:hypothetical protein